MWEERQLGRAGSEQKQMDWDSSNDLGDGRERDEVAVRPDMG